MSSQRYEQLLNQQKLILLQKVISINRKDTKDFAKNASGW